MSATATPVRTLTEDTAYDEELVLDDLDEDWWCVATNPFPCPAHGCDFVAEFMTAAHLIIVWPSKDDHHLLRHADMAAQVDRNPRVIRYEQNFGPAIAYDVWRGAGSPVHGVRNRPDGYGPRF